MTEPNKKPTTALLVIDLQKDVLASCFDAAGVLTRTQNLIARARKAGVPVIFVQHEEPEMPRNSPGWELVETLKVAAGDLRVYKTFRDAFAGTDLGAQLSQLKVNRLILTGAQSDYCVRSTAHRAAIEGYDLVLVSDCHTTEDASFHGVSLTGEQIVAHTNLYFSGLTYPGIHCGIATHDQVIL